MSKRVAQSLGLPWTSFGEYIRILARQQGRDTSIEVLQEIGATQVSGDCEGFCRAVLQQVQWEPGQSLVIDSIRHTQVEEILENLVKPSIMLTVFLDVDDRIRLTHLREENITDPSDIERVESHSTEAQVRTVLPKTADLVVKGDGHREILIGKLVALVKELMDDKNFLNQPSAEELSGKIASLASAEDGSALTHLRGLLLEIDGMSCDKYDLPRMACRGLLQKGVAGVQALVSTIQEAPGIIYPAAIIESLWHAAQGQHPPAFMLGRMPIMPPLNLPLSPEIVTAAREAFYDLITESQISESLFDKLLHFLYQNNSYIGLNSKAGADAFRLSVFEIFTESSIRITKRLIDEFERLVSSDLPEKEYQQFLAANPVFIDPLADQIVDQQKLGLEYKTDFVVRRLDNEYILVEIEKPQDSIFTAKNDFTAEFTHAFGQVIDFQEWVDSHSEYARYHMPGISSPRGLLVMGKRKDLSPEQSAKLKRYCINSQAITVFTYDDLIERAKTLYENIRTKLNAL
ncbi:MAG TPA: Shedu anti-phage system protein SduA domain-containing protein [Blastocatellia bacterium]|nr:Shedu anti-phage system protein SduA domain-containing protein [Blastocatellia bacterium]